MRTITRATAMDVERGVDHLTSLRGVGPWTAAEVRRRALGDPDAVPVGDYHLPKLVGHTLIGEPVDDAGMLELLEPFTGQRGASCGCASSTAHGRPGAAPACRCGTTVRSERGRSVARLQVS